MRAEQKDASVCLCDPNASALQFPRGYRLTHKQQFDRVLTLRSFQARSGCFRVFASANELSVARLGLIVGKRQLKRAVDRNRVKRVLRETFRVQRARLPALDIVVQLIGSPHHERFRIEANSLWPLLLDTIGKENGQRPR
jgi:ribonuclease P protein component